MSYQNFALAIIALPNGKYRIEMQSPVGEASVEADSPFTPDEITLALQIFSREQRISHQDELNAARDFGQRLFKFTLQSSSEISNAYFASLRDATGDGLRIRLTVDQAGALSSLPWEFLRDPANDFLALSRRTPIVRYTQQLDVRPPAAITLPLRVLVMISAPSDFPALDVEGEWQRLQDATAPLRDKGLLLLERLDTATLIALQRRLRDADYHIFHYIGHSDYDAGSQQGVLVFESEREPGKAQIISGEALSRELAEESTVRLVVLNSCHSANRPPDDALAGISSGLVTRGIPAVVAMQFAISDVAAKAFAEEFYRAIAELLPIDASTSEGRRAIANRVGNNEWATPVLFMRSDDGILFKPAAETVTTAPPPSPATATPLSPPPTVHSHRLVLAAAGIIIVLMLAAFGVARLIIPPLPLATPTPAALPDLQVGAVRVAPRNPAPGQIFILSITITNAGKADSGPFKWAWDASTTQPFMTNSLSGDVDNIPPGVSKNISFPFSYGWWGTYSSQLRVDSDTRVVESDESNNFKFLEVDMALQPFVVDFSLLPSNQLVEPPMTLAQDTFASWNLDFAVDASSNPACANTPLELVDQGEDVLLTVGSDNAACKNLPISITILRAPVSAATAEIIPVADGSATYAYYGDADGKQVLFQSQPVPLQAGQVTQLAPNDTTRRAIRRIEISVPGQQIQLTRLMFSPPNS
ncbi:MAG TPA: CHAT domain-containing protein [Phototrophicaceae bacterium]|nr:CHAT domain-containing protein [Phototrophicaceae bacterium]